MEIDVTKLFEIDVPQPELTARAQLVAAPSLNDFCFRRTVVQILSHNHEGSMGLVLNRHTGIRLSALMPDYPKADSFPLYCGGPVGLDTLFILHRMPPMSIPGSDNIGNGFFLGGDSETMKHLIEKGDVTPTDVRFIIGYSGWSEGQLADEIESGFWAVSPQPILSRKALEVLPTRLWSDAVVALGDVYKVWLAVPDLPILN